MKKLCTRADGSACTSVAARSRATPVAPAIPASESALQRFARRAAYAVFMIAVPGSVLMLAAWHWRDLTHWLAERMRGLASTH